MTRIAHITDLHLLEEECEQRSGMARYRLGFLSAGTAWDPHGRRVRASRQLARARALDVDHVLITGDLTEDGQESQFSQLAEVLAGSGFAPEQITMVPGNHDGYSSNRAFEGALDGPLKAYRRTSCAEAVTVLDEVVIKPLSTVIPNQAFTFAAGRYACRQLREIARLCRHSEVRGKALVVAQHHPPQAMRNPARNLIEGTLDAGPMRDLLDSESHVHVVHGHTHRWATDTLSGREHAQILCGTAARDDEDSLRIYTAAEGRLWTQDDRSTPNGGAVEAVRRLVGAYRAA